MIFVNLLHVLGCSTLRLLATPLQGLGWSTLIIIATLGMLLLLATLLHRLGCSTNLLHLAIATLGLLVILAVLLP